MKTQTIKIRENLLSITMEDLKKRREAVDATISTHAIEDVKLHSKTLKILEGYAKGTFHSRI